MPGGFGLRGVEGMVLTAQYARENDIPYFGICLGMQVAVIEFARNVLGLDEANSLEMVEETEHAVICLMGEHKNIANLGESSRLGEYPCNLVTGSKSSAIYDEKMINERHRHRFEFNNEYIDMFEKSGMKIAGVCPTGGQVEIIENTNNAWMIGVQFHPEFLSRPVRPHPLFRDFIAAAIAKKNNAEDNKESKR